METESSIYKSVEEEKSKEKTEPNNYKTYFPLQENNNINSRLTQIPSKAQIYYYEKNNHDLSNTIIDLNTKIEKLLLQQEKSKAIIDSHQTEIKILKEQLLNQTNNNQNLSDEIANNELMIDELKDLNKKLINTNKIKLDTLNNELNEKETVINDISKKIKEKDEIIKYYTVNNSLSQKYINNFKTELNNEKIKNKNLEQKIEQLNSQIDNLYIQNQSEGSLLLKIEQLKDDNIRLIQMLKSMKQAENIESLYGDNSSIRNIKIYKNNNKNNAMLNEAFNYGIKLKQKFGLDISNTILKNFVAGLNTIWQEKYNKDIKEIKKNYQKVIDSINSQSLSKNDTQIINNLKSDNMSVNSLSNNMSNCNSNKKEMNDDGKNYKNLINNYEYEKGCFWMIERCKEEMNNLEKNLNELFQEYEQKLNNSLNDYNKDNNEYYSRVVNNCVKWFFSTLKSMINDTNNKLNDWGIEIKKKCESV